MTNPAQEGELLNLLTDTQAIMSRLFAHRARDLGLTRPQWRVLGRLYRRPGTTQVELAELTGMAPSPLGKIVDQLEANALVERRRDPNDRRVNRLYVTEAVQPLVGPAQALARELEQAALARISQGASLRQQLDELRVSLSELAELELGAGRT